MRRLIALLLISFPPVSEAQLSSAWTAENILAWPLLYNLPACFSPGQVTVSGGYLTIAANNTSSTCQDYNLDGSTKTGPLTKPHQVGMIITNSFTFQYGTVSFRARASSLNNAIWPAVWMSFQPCQSTYPFTVDNIGNCVFDAAHNYKEIDIMESVGTPHTSSMSVHTPGQGTPQSGDGGTCSSEIKMADWHVYSMVWTSSSVALSIDGTLSCTLSGNYIPQVPMFLLIDNIVQTSQTGPLPVSPQNLQVDYIRVVQSGITIFDDEFGSDPSPIGQATANKSIGQKSILR